MAFNWNDNFSLGIAEIDNQHKKLFDIGNRIYEMIKFQSEYDNYDKILLILDELIEYTEFHFKYEEIILKEKKYPKYHTHKKEHLSFTTKIKRTISSNSVDNDQKRMLLDMLEFLSIWLKDHILVADKEYAGFLLCNS